MFLAPPRALILGAILRAELQRWSAQCAPREACGFLLGRHSGEVSIVGAVTLDSNVHETPERAFEIDPVATLRAHDTATEAGLHVLGVWHSHPASETAKPSAADTAGAWRGHVALIVAQREWRAYFKEADGLTPLVDATLNDGDG